MIRVCLSIQRPRMRTRLSEKEKGETAFSIQPTERITRPGDDDPIIGVKRIH